MFIIENMHSKRAQAALEYLMTYGFALLIIAIVIGVLIFMGIIKLPAASTCTGLEKFAYSDHTVDANGNFVIYLLNGTGGRITNVSAEATEGLAGSCAPSSSAINATADFNIYCITDLSQGQTYSGKIKINYTTRRGAVHIEKATCTGTALYVPIPIPNVPPQTALLSPNEGGNFWSNGPKVIIKFTVLDLDDSDPKANIYYSAQQGEKKIPIVQNLNLLGLAQSPQPDRNCSGGGDFSTAQTCYYDWNAYNIQTTEHYYIDLKISDEVSSAEDSSDSNLMLYKYIAKSKFTFESDYVTGNQKALIRSNNGTKIYFAYASGKASDTSSEIYFMQSDDNGSTWSAPANVSKTTSGSIAPTIVVDANDFIHVAWRDAYPPTGGWTRTFYSQCRQNCTDQDNWSTPIYFPSNTFRADLSADSNTLYMVYDTSSGISYTSCTADCNSSANWAAPTALNTTVPAANPQIVAEDNGTKHMTYWSFSLDTSYRNIFYMACTTDCNNASNWSADLNISQGSSCGSGRYYQYMALDSNGKLHVTFMCLYAGILYRACASGCSSIGNWTSLAPVTTAWAWTPSMAVDSGNNVYVAWQDYGGDAMYRRYNASSSSFGSIVNLTQNALGTYIERANPDASAETGLDKLDIVWATGPEANGDYNLSFYTRLLKGS